MKKILLGLTCLLLTGTAALAQQKPQYSQYMLNQYIINPALSGIESYVDIKASHRHQWVGIQDAPVTSYFTIQMPLGMRESNLYSNYGEATNPRGKEYWEAYETPESHHGVGAQIINDQTGPISNLSAYLTYAYHLRMGTRTNLAAGFGAGMKRLSLNTSKLQFGSPVDPAIMGSGILNKTTLDVNAGLYLYNSDFFIGVSANQILPQRLDFSTDTVRKTVSRMVPHIFATAGYRLLLGEELNFTPSVMVKYLKGLPVQYDINAKLMYRDLLWLGAGYRLEEGYMAFAGLNVSNRVSVGYSYDYTTSRLNAYSRGTHEFLVGFTIANGTGDTCPRNIW